jgi:serine protease DegQ
VRGFRLYSQSLLMRRIWLVFAQAVTISLAVLFVISTLRPELLPSGSSEKVVVMQEQNAKLPAQKIVSYREPARKAMPAVVNIVSSKGARSRPHPLAEDPLFRRFFGEPDRQQRAPSLGSGVIVSSQGYVLTNHHVIEAADEIDIVLADGRTAPARVAGTDPETDLAVLKVSVEGLPSITFASSDEVQVGDIVLAIGNPFGVGQTVTLGIISATGRSKLGISTFENFIQTDAAINPGNSGGALVDAFGNLIGINSAIYSRTGGSLGIGFAISSNVAKEVMQQIIETGSVTRGWIGVEVQDLAREVSDSSKLGNGALISGVLRGGPADRGGIRAGDVLLKVGDKGVTDSAAVLHLIASLQPGARADLIILREGREFAVPVDIGRRPNAR